ncbi:MAG TPA: hypothetical protein VFR32_11810 [Gaiellaceae bacterium]|nr:hypothetical protein [Gaiellaceae bacterium]
MTLKEELEEIAVAARQYDGDGEKVAAVIAAEPADGMRVYLCAFASGEARSWLGLRDDGQPVTDRTLLLDAVSIAALCELADEFAGRLDEHPRVATPAYLEAASAEAGRDAASFAEAMKQGVTAVEGLVAEVEGAYRIELR